LVDLVKISLVFLVIIILLYKKVRLWISLLAATLILGLLFRLSLTGIGMNLLTATLETRTLLLLGALIAILFFSYLLKETGRMEEILEGFMVLFKDLRIVVAILPAVIGLMPILGGALVSAPMVVEGSDKLGLSPERRTFVNYWFRHVWEFILPTFPGLVLFATLIGVPVRRFGWINLPFTLTAIFGGFLVGYQGISRSLEERKYSASLSLLWRLLQNLFPLFLAIILVVVFDVELVIALGVSLLVMILLFRVGRQGLKNGFVKSLDIELLLTVAIIMGFKKVLESSQAIQVVSQTLSSSGVPALVIVMGIPFLVGLMAGTPFAAIGIAFPILIPLLQNDLRFLDYMTLAFVSGLSGHMLSPFHLCLVLTKEYFQADWKGIYRLTWIPVALLLGVGLLKATFFKIP